MPGLHHVEPGGAPLTLPLSPTVTMTKLSVGEMDNNAYLLQPATGPAVLVDAAAEPDRVVSVIDDRTVATIVTTHRHGDHWQALAAVADVTGAALLAGRPDVAAIEQGAGVRGMQPVWDGDTLPLGSERLTVIGLVGHTPGSVALLYRGGDVPHLLTGDCLFPGGVGRVTSPENFRSLLHDVETKLFARLPDETVVHPGHGDSTTLGAERPHLEEWRERGW